MIEDKYIQFSSARKTTLSDKELYQFDGLEVKDVASSDTGIIKGAIRKMGINYICDVDVDIKDGGTVPATFWLTRLEAVDESKLSPCDWAKDIIKNGEG